jgi:hypothetical protein
MLEMGRAVRVSGKPASESRTELVTSQIRGRSCNGSTMVLGRFSAIEKWIRLKLVYYLIWTV